MTQSLRRTWLGLTAWYVCVFGLVLALFGTGLYLVVTREISAAIDRGLQTAIEEAIFAVNIREREVNVHSDEHIDALDELNVPGHDMYVFDGNGVILRPEWAPDFVDLAARAALEGDSVLRTVPLPDRTLRLRAQAFDAGAARYVAVAVAEAFALDRQYPGLVRAFLFAGCASLLLVALGGSLLARQSLIPVQQSFQRMRRFVDDASHELRTPAAVLRSTADVALQRPRSTEEYEKALATIRDEATGLGHLVDGLLLLAAADNRKLVIRRELIYLDDLLADAAQAARALVGDRDVTIRIVEFEETPVSGDPVLLRQLLLIVLDNAIKYSPRGGVVECAVTAAGGQARVRISDQGPGIPAEALPHIFERFYRADPSRTGRGAGIGLSVAAAIADAHGATIRIDSRPGAGTTIFVNVPLAARGENVQPPLESAPR